jgi:translation elongation factor EF-Ts
MLRRYSGGFQADRTALAHTAEGTIAITISEANTNAVMVRVTGIIFIPI